MSLANNEVIKQLRNLHNVAIDLKEKFDISASLEVLQVLQEQYGKELERLIKMIPREVMSKTNLMRHSQFLDKYIVEGKPDNCYSDLRAICGADIFETEEAYFHYLEETQDKRERDLDWSIIHQRIYELAKPRFGQGLYSDAIEASFKELNKLIKEEYIESNGKELDGDKLMRKVFSSSSNNEFNPIFHITTNESESGKNKQEGYMNIFAGVMRGIRNPHAHDNLELNLVEAWELLIISSHLMKVWDNRIKKQ